MQIRLESVILTAQSMCANVGKLHDLVRRADVVAANGASNFQSNLLCAAGLCDLALTQINSGCLHLGLELSDLDCYAGSCNRHTQKAHESCLIDHLSSTAAAVATRFNMAEQNALQALEAIAAEVSTIASVALCRAEAYITEVEAAGTIDKIPTTRPASTIYDGARHSRNHRIVRWMKLK
ncbi:hypothetical protein BH10CYA1_BH10CYA1_43520 [soil metagenome]